GIVTLDTTTRSAGGGATSTAGASAGGSSGMQPPATGRARRRRNVLRMSFERSRRIGGAHAQARQARQAREDPPGQASTGAGHAGRVRPPGAVDDLADRSDARGDALFARGV